MMADISTHLLGLRQRFENKNCQVHWLDPTLDIFISDSQPHFDLIVLDLTQTSDQCLAAYQKLKAHPKLANTPVIILTADKEARAIVSGSDKGPNYYLFETPKPIVEAKVEAKIWQLIEQIPYLAASYS
jgi:DNA-binding response OmpR family regulator